MNLSFFVTALNTKLESAAQLTLRFVFGAVKKTTDSCFCFNYFDWKHALRAATPFICFFF
jgi:hypothetical protein